MAAFALLHATLSACGAANSADTCDTLGVLLADLATLPINIGPANILKCAEHPEGNKVGIIPRGCWMRGECGSHGLHGGFAGSRAREC